MMCELRMATCKSERAEYVAAVRVALSRYYSHSLFAWEIGELAIYCTTEKNPFCRSDMEMFT